jgi:hypothetical protein
VVAALAHDSGHDLLEGHADLLLLFRGEELRLVDGFFGFF